MSLWKISPLIGLFALLLCTGDYNPFEDVSNARVYVLAGTSEVADGDSVTIFTARRMVLGVTVAGQLDSFRVNAPGNRYWSDTCVRAPSRDDYILPLSFIDTGWISVVITASRVNGDAAVEMLRLYSRSPLAQGDIDTTVGAELTFSTAGVGDTVWYHWVWEGEFFGGAVHSRMREYSGRYERAGDFTGTLWVSVDSLGLVDPSPKSGFLLRLRDNAGPVIECLNPGARGDTVLTGDRIFMFEASITDASGIRQALVDGGAFDYMSPPRYAITYRDMADYGPERPKTVSVHAVDRNDNATTRGFFLVFDADAPSSYGTIITVESAGDTITTGAGECMVVGTVKDYTHAVVEIAGRLNNKSDIAARRVVIEDGVGYWGMRVAPSAGSNTLVITAADTLGRELARKSVIIFRDAGVIDTAGPAILSVRILGITVSAGQTVFVRDSVGGIDIVTYDQSGVAGVTVNGVSAVPLTADSIRWGTTVGPIAHSVPSTVVIRAVDNAGSESVYAFSARRNIMPSIEESWTWPERFFAGIPWEGRFRVVDEDEGVMVRMTGAPAAMSLEALPGVNLWQCAWTPAENDTGTRNVLVTLSDAFEETSFVWTFIVLGDSSRLLSLITRPDDFPRFLEADRDTLHRTIECAADRGAAPFRYRAWLGAKESLLLDTVSAARTVPLVWAPRAADIGLRQLFVTVFDAAGDADTLFRDVEVVPRNGDSCALRLVLPPGVDTTAAGEIDLRQAAAPAVLTFVIEDDDHPFTERHIVRVFRGGIVKIDTLRAALDFSVILDTASTRWRDTLVVTIEDRTGGRDTVTVLVVYRADMPRPSPEWEWPKRFIAGSAFEAPFTLVPGDYTASLSLNNAPAGLAFVPAGERNRWTLAFVPSPAQAGVYDVGVELTNGYQDTVIQWRFTVLADSTALVRIELDGTVPGYGEAGDTLRIGLKPGTGTGALPFRYTAWVAGRPELLADTVTGAESTVYFSWITATADIGAHHLVMAIEDGYGDRDTLYRDIEIVPRNGMPCALRLVIPAGLDTTADGAVDMSLADGSETLWVEILDGDHPLTERYVVRVTRDNVTTVKDLDAAAPVAIVLTPSTGRTRDTITVSVGDQTGTADTLRIIAQYRSSWIVKINTSSSGAAVTEGVAGFPLLVRLTGGNFDFSGFDETEPALIFMRGQNELPHEIESWSASGQAAAVWVLVDTVFGNRADQRITMSAGSGSHESSGASVFSSGNGFVGVWHMNPVAGVVADATASGLDAEVKSSTGLGSTGFIGNAATFNGSGDYLEVAGNPAHAIDDDFTFSGWVRLDNDFTRASTVTRVVAEKYLDNDYNMLLAFIGTDYSHSYIDSTGMLMVKIEQYGSNGRNYFWSRRKEWQAGAWYHFAVVNRAMARSSCEIYINGVAATDTSRVTSGSGPASLAFSAPLRFAGYRLDTDQLSEPRYLDGGLDEMRLSRGVRSAAWIRLSYETQRPDGTAVTVE